MNALFQMSLMLEKKIKQINSIKSNLEIEINQLRNRQLSQKKIERNIYKLRRCLQMCREVYKESILLSNYFIESNFNISKILESFNCNYQKLIQINSLQMKQLRESRDQYACKSENQGNQIYALKLIINKQVLQIQKKDQLVQKLKNNIKQLINKNNQTTFITEETLNEIQSINIQEGYGQDICSRSPAIQYPPIRNCEVQKQNKKDITSVSVSCWLTNQQKQQSYLKQKIEVSQKQSMTQNTDIELNKQSIDQLKKIIQKISLEEKQIQKKQEFSFLNQNQKIQIYLQPFKQNQNKLKAKNTINLKNSKQEDQYDQYEKQTTLMKNENFSLNNNFQKLQFFTKKKKAKVTQINKSFHSQIEKQNKHPFKTQENQYSLKKLIQVDRRGSMYIPLKKQSNMQSGIALRRKFSLLEKNNTIKEVNEELRNFHISIGESRLQQKYEGTKKNGVRDGKGKLWYVNGFIYEGDFNQNVRHGLGALYLNERQIYRGAWKKDKLCGQGTLNNFQLISKKKLAQNSILRKAYYSGSFYDNKFDGKGTLFLNEQKLVRNFKNGLISE